MESKVTRSYLGIGSCAVFSIATVAILTVILSSWRATYKLAGLEIVVVGPFAIVLYVVGLFFAISGLKDRENNPLVRVGLVLNAIPLAYLIVHICRIVLAGDS